MARFYGDLDGKTTRMGHAPYGLTGHVRGWSIGGQVRMSADGDTDTVRLALTGGSHCGHVPCCEIVASSDGTIVVRVPAGVTVERTS